MEGTRTWGGAAFSPRKAVFPLRASTNLQGCLNGVSGGLPWGRGPPRLISDLSLQPRYPTVMSSLFLISIQKTVSGGPWIEGLGSGGGQEMSHRDRESQKINLFSPKEKGKNRAPHSWIWMPRPRQ